MMRCLARAFSSADLSGVARVGAGGSTITRGRASQRSRGTISVSPAHPPASIQSPLQLHAGTTHASGDLFAFDSVDSAIPANRVIRAYGTAFPNTQHRIQIRSPEQASVGVAGQLRLPTKTPIPQRHKNFLPICVCHL